jgi:hypothetical protein
MNDFEKEILDSPHKMCQIHNLLRQHQFSEEFLIKTIDHYDSWQCLKTQKNLSPYFCFRYLYDNPNDSADDWTDYYDVLRYFKNSEYSIISLNNIFQDAMDDRKAQIMSGYPNCVQPATGTSNMGETP